MTELVQEEVKLAPDAAVLQAARNFAETLADTPQFKAYEAAAERRSRDAAAQQAMAAYRSKQSSLQAMLMLNAVSGRDRDELEHLRQELLSNPSVAAHLQAQEDLTVLCRAAADLLSERIGLSFTAACGPGCC